MTPNTPKYYTLHGWNGFGALTCLHGHDPEELSGVLKESDDKYKTLKNRFKALRNREPEHGLSMEWASSGGSKASEAKQREILDKYDFESGLSKETSKTTLLKTTSKSQHDGEERMYYPQVCNHFHIVEENAQTFGKLEKYATIKYVRMVPRSCSWVFCSGFCLLRGLINILNPTLISTLI
jgi:hypothetical protein